MKSFLLIILTFVGLTIQTNAQSPTVTTKLTDAFPIEMPELYAFPIYINVATDDPATFAITTVELDINGTIIPATLENDYYLAWWTPESTGNFDVKITANGDNASSTTETVSITVTDVIATQNVQTFDGETIWFDGSGASRWFYGNYTLPQSIGAYNNIMANFKVTCPSGDCDDWDRLGYVEYKAPDGTWMELFRYITPYRVACDHTIDVTDYASLLHGNIELRMHIDTWGTGGWDIHLDLDYTAGTPDYLYSHIQEIWHGYYSFGDPANLQPMDVVSIDFPEDTEKSIFRITTTGHGWGQNNTGNAAEFYNAKHHFHVNGIETYEQHLWNDCNPNPDNCTGQQGTWKYSRAGWCPGAIAPPHSYDISEQIAIAPFDFSYIFKESYQDNCHANNPDCISKTTCDDCNAGYNPAYQIGAYIVSFSQSTNTVGVKGIAEVEEFNVTVFPNPSNGVFNLNLSKEMNDIVVSINEISGKTIRNYFFESKAQLDAFQFNLTALSKGTYFIKVNTEHQISVNKIVLD